MGILLLVGSAAPQAADLEKLADTPRWRALLHYNNGAVLRARGRSYIADPDFFLAKNGHKDPVAELKASIKTLKPEQSKQRCQLPARYRFLSKQLGWQDDKPLAHCKKYNKWRSQIQARRAILVFPASYLNSPSSMFGHTLIRLDKGPNSPAWLSWAINYGAVVDDDDNSLLYAWRGISGGYPGRFSIEPYANKLREYSHMENRDIWEYTLKLDQTQINWLVEHLWELQGINTDYYFIDENCSFRLLELIQVARPESNLLEKLRIAELPIRAVRTLDKRGLIADRHYRPSRMTQLQQYSDQLNGEEKKLAKRLAKNPDLIKKREFTSHPRDRQALMVLTAYRYLRFIHRKGPRTRRTARHSLALLHALNKLPSPSKPKPLEATPPESGHGSQMLAFSGGMYGHDAYGELGYRLTYHGLLDNARGYLPGAQIEGMGLSLRGYGDGRIKLESLDLLNIRSLTPRDAFSKPISWYVNLGMEHGWAGKRRSLRFFQGGAGLSWRFGSVQPYMLASARLENNAHFSPFIVPGGGAEIGAILYAHDWQWQLSNKGHYFSNNEFRNKTRLATQYALTRDHGIRAKVSRESRRGGGATSFQLQWRWYLQ